MPSTRSNDEPAPKRRKAEIPRQDWRLDAKDYFSDWTIQVVDDKNKTISCYHVHRLVLVTKPFASLYFRDIFANKTRRQQKAASKFQLSAEQAKIFPEILDIVYGKLGDRAIKYDSDYWFFQNKPRPTGISLEDLLATVELCSRLQLTDLGHMWTEILQKELLLSNLGLRTLLEFHKKIMVQNVSFFDVMPFIVDKMGHFVDKGFLHQQAIDWATMPVFEPALLISMVRLFHEKLKKEPRRLVGVLEPPRAFEFFLYAMSYILPTQGTMLPENFFEPLFTAKYLSSMRELFEYRWQVTSLYFAHLNIVSQFQPSRSQELSSCQQELVKHLLADKATYSEKEYTYIYGSRQEKPKKPFRSYVMAKVFQGYPDRFKQACQYIPKDIVSDLLWEGEVVEIYTSDETNDGASCLSGSNGSDSMSSLSSKTVSLAGA